MLHENKFVSESKVVDAEPVPDPPNPQVPSPAFAWLQSSDAVNGIIAACA
jgi:hypothetical protein